MISFHAFRMGRCLLAAAVTQALITIPVAAQTAASTQEQSQETKADVKGAVKLKEVVVTAQRRAQNIQVVPVSVSALNEAQLDARGIMNVADLSSVAPNLTVVVTPGSTISAAIAIRGSVQSNPAPYWDAPVAMYVDGVYMGKTEGNMFELLNLERIEVLRGPQGTLFGRNTMAGAVSLITRPPSGQFTGDASVGFGNYGGKVGKVTVDLPAMGKLKVSVGGRVERRDGWVKTTTGSAAPYLASRHNNEAYAALEYDATDNLTLNYRFDYTNVDQYGTFNQVIYSEVEQTFGIPGVIVSADGRQATASIDTPDFERNKVEGNALTATWKLGDLGTLKYIGAYRTMHHDAAFDNDGSPIPLAKSAQQSRYRQISHELQYLGSYGRWDWVGGLYFFEDDGYTRLPQSFFFGQVRYDNNENGFGTRSRAAYAQVDYKLTDQLTLTAGLRRTLDNKRASRFQELVNPPVVLVPDGTAAKTTAGATTPMLTLAYQLTTNNMVYARYAKGFMAGGFNGAAQTVLSSTTPFKPQTQQTYEIGSKNTFLDGRLSLNAAIFYNRINNLQETVFTASGALGVAVLNVGSAHSQGFELEAHVHPTEDLTLGLNYGYLQEKYDKFMVDGVNVADNRAVQFAPRNTASLVLDDILARTSKGVLRATVDYRFTSKFYAYVFPFTQITPPSQLAGNSAIGSYNLLNARIAFSDMDWGHGVSGEVSLWVKNLTNREHIDSIIDFGPSFGNLQTVNYNDPRMFGVTATARW